MDEYIVLSIPRRQAQLHYVANAVMTGINDVLPLDNDDDEDAISLKIFLKEGAWASFRNVLGFKFDGNPGERTIWLTDYLRTNILAKLQKWIR